MATGNDRSNAQMPTENIASLEAKVDKILTIVKYLELHLTGGETDRQSEHQQTEEEAAAEILKRLKKAFSDSDIKKLVDIIGGEISCTWQMFTELGLPERNVIRVKIKMAHAKDGYLRQVYAWQKWRDELLAEHPTWQHYNKEQIRKLICVGLWEANNRDVDHPFTDEFTNLFNFWFPQKKSIPKCIAIWTKLK